MKRIFIAGIARSGTTLLQSMIGSHPEILAFPETHFWDKTLYKQKYLRCLQVINTGKLDHVKTFLQSINSGTELKNWPKYVYSKQKLTKLFVNLLDEISFSENKTIWVEKTPLTLYFIDLIQKTFPDSLFIHTVREGLDNIASLYHATINNPDYFSQSTIDKCINRYVNEISISEKYTGRTNHFFVKYDLLVDQTENTLRDLCNFFEIRFSYQMLAYRNTAAKLITKEEKWKEKNVNMISRSDKKNLVFNDTQREYISRKIKHIDLDIF